MDPYETPITPIRQAQLTTDCLCSFAVAYKPSVLIPGMDHDMQSFPAAAPAPASIPQTMADGFRSNGAGSTSHVYSPPPNQPSQIVQVSISSSPARVPT